MQAAHLSGDGSFDVKVVGASRRQTELELICGGRDEHGVEHECLAELIPEPNNPHDRNAIRVEIDGHHVGYLSRENAVQLRAELRKGKVQGMRLTCDALIVGGWDRGDGDQGHFGVRLDLA
jgi:hypothetical protein